MLHLHRLNELTSCLQTGEGGAAGRCTQQRLSTSLEHPLHKAGGCDACEYRQLTTYHIGGLADVALPAAIQAPTGPASKGGKKGGKKGKGRKGKAAAAATSAEDTEGADMPQAAPTAATEPLDVPGQPHLDTFDAGCGHLSDSML